MKIIQSYWSKPGNLNKNDFLNFNRCGWLDRKYHYFAWILSAKQLLKYYKDVELVTDNQGYDLLINKLEIPYSKASVELNEIKDYHPNLWAMGKILSYRLQKEAFIHVDGDVFIWKKFTEKLENAELLCQNPEEGFSYDQYYRKAFLPIALNFDYYPEVLNSSINKNGCIKAVNAGILGGTNIKFVQNYTEEALAFINKNITKLKLIDSSLFNVIFEQFLFRSMADHNNIDIAYFHNSTVSPHFFEFAGIPDRTSYIHLSGTSKKDILHCTLLENKLRTEYPMDYARVIRLLKKNQI
ncbi:MULTISPECIES: DUF6734 family protein [Sphingobacterium]|uniref:DUF6734 family protein n=1 Tax=Sphingobacterium TaxID=28453 RepID=UPI000B4911CC|nr:MULTISPECIES: DUF6734 family protein [Sphingobacterium]